MSARASTSRREEKHTIATITGHRRACWCCGLCRRATYQDQADTDPLNRANVDKQPQLNDAGRAKAGETGGAFKKLGIPAGQVVASQYFRAIEWKNWPLPPHGPRCAGGLRLVVRVRADEWAKLAQ